MYAIQRRLVNGGHARWNTMTRVPEDKMLEAMRLAVQLAKIGQHMDLRVCSADAAGPPLFVWTAQQGWVGS